MKISKVIILCAALCASAITAEAGATQMSNPFPAIITVITTNTVGDIQTITMTTGPATINVPPPPPTFSDALSVFGRSVAQSTNLAVIGFVGKKLTSGSNPDYVAGGLVSFNLMKNLALVGGAEHLWGETNSASFTLSGGIGLNASFNVLSNSWLNLNLNPFAISLVGSPLNGANGGNLMNVNRLGADFDIHTFQDGWVVSIGGAYGNRTGCGLYDGNWADIFLAVKHKFRYSPDAFVGSITAQVSAGSGTP